jgi:hypothetical protein
MQPATITAAQLHGSTTEDGTNDTASEVVA